MGLPLFITPKEPEAVAKSPEKLAAIPRSAIRRRPGPSRPRPNPNSLRRRLLGSLEHVREGAYQLWEGTNARQTAEDAESGLGASIHARAQRMLEEEQSRIRESPRFWDAQPTGTNESDAPAMPAVPEAESFTRSQDEALRNLHRTRQLRRMARRHAAPTPPYYDDPQLMGANDFGAPRRMPSYDLGPPPFSTFETSPPPVSSLTPALSPVHHSGNSSPRRPPIHESWTEPEPFTSFLSRMQSGRTSLTERIHSLNRSTSDALNRTSSQVARSRTQLRQARIHLGRLDGLGDRNRSLSPEGGAAWDTLLTSITPDPQQPSAGSSFASTSAAAATVSMSNSVPSSANTSMTSSRETRDPTLRDCDLSDGSSTDEEDEEDIYELREFNNSRSRGGAYDRTYANAAVTLTSEAEHLDGMHHIISRLAERDEIPDEWWASAGLSRRNLRREPST